MEARLAESVLGFQGRLPARKNSDSQICCAPGVGTDSGGTRRRSQTAPAHPDGARSSSLRVLGIPLPGSRDEA